MEYRTFGRTGVRVSAIGVGGGPAGVPNYLMPWDSSAAEEQANPQIDVALVGMRTADEVDRNADLVESGRYRVDLAKLHGEFVTRVP